MMSDQFVDALDRRFTGALLSGALFPPPEESLVLDNEGLPFIVRWPTSGTHYHAVDGTPPGGVRDTDDNPFLSPDPELTVGPVGEQHVAILNKFPVSVRHLVLARTQFRDQQTGLGMEDFQVLAALVTQLGGLGFYNGGAQAGASQRHKHVQWIPGVEGSASLLSYTALFNEVLDDQTLLRHPGLPVHHCFVRVLAGRDISTEQSATSMYNSYYTALSYLGLHPDSQGVYPPFNLLVDDSWMLVVARHQERFKDIPINALAYGGLIVVELAQHVDVIRQAGPQAILASVGRRSQS